MKATISRWGNSLGVRIPKAALEDAHLAEGDQVDVVSENGKLVMTRKDSRSTLDQLVARITPENQHVELITDRAGNEVW